MDKAYKNEFEKQIEQLNPDQQLQVLEYVQLLINKKIKGTPGEELIYFAGSIPKSDLDVISSVIKEDCEKIDQNEW